MTFGTPGEVGTFGTVDYVVFGCMLGVSVLIGIYHAFAGGGQKTTKAFLLADGNMNPIPVAASLVATFISAITVLGTPAEMYTYGSTYWLFALSFITSGLFVARFCIPMFFRINGLTSANQYLEMRFNKAARIAALLCFMAQMLIYMGIVIYAPALALNQVTGINLWGSVLATGLVCTFYTSIGGMKAVLWTDCFQMIIMLSGFFAAIIEGARRVGGLDEVWRICDEGERINTWNFDPDPTVRHTFWTIVVGGTWTWGYTYGVNQAQVQRYLSCGTEKRAYWALFLGICGMIIVVSLACVSGLTMYAYYAGCDPIQLGYVAESDQLMPYFILDLFGDYPGLPGLFTSAVFSGALSSVSSGLNALAAVTTEDFVKSVWKDISDAKMAWISKGVAMGYGLFAIFLSYVVSLMSGSVLTISLSLFGMIGGPLFGIFSLGMFFPWANSKGAVTGIISGLILTLWIGIGAVFYPPTHYKPPLTIDKCGFNQTTPSMFTDMMDTTTMVTPEPWPPITAVYTISYIYYPIIGWSCTILVGLLVSFLTGHQKAEDADPKLYVSFSDAMYCCLPESIKKVLRCGVPRWEDIRDQYEEEDELKVKKDDLEVLTMTEHGVEEKVAYASAGTSTQDLPKKHKEGEQNGGFASTENTYF